MAGALENFSPFRLRLKTELERWKKEGIVDQETADAIARRHELDKISTDTSAIFFRVIFFIGVILIGLGVISFVAANWKALDAWVKIAIVMSAMLACHVGGYILWRVRKTRPILGHSLVLLGSLIFGANIALIAQIFHIRGEYYDMFFAWSVGAVFMGYALLSVPNMLLAILTSFVWFMGWIWSHEAAPIVYPLAAGLLFIPFAYESRSRNSHAAALLAVAVSILVCGILDKSVAAGFLTTAAVGAVLFCYGDYHRAARFHASFQDIGRGLGLLTLSISLYLLSFHGLHEELSRFRCGAEGMWQVYVYASFALAFALCLVNVKRGIPAHLSIQYRGMFLGAASIAAVSLLPLGEIAGTVLANTALVVIGWCLLRVGLAELNRSMFWYGLLVFIVVIVSRFFEYETGLLVKSIVLIAIGVAVVCFGVAFEKRVRRVKEDA